VKSQSYYFEIKDVMLQFISAFDDVIIKRFDRGRSTTDKIQVKYVYAPKKRVLEDLINKSQHITLPVISVSQASISRDVTRVFNKLEGTYHSANPSDDIRVTGSDYLPPPLPININVNMSILCKYQSDMEQILQNFMVYTNPYIVISWRAPKDLLTKVHEIRSEVLWSGDISLDYPYDIQSTQPARITADTTFTIKGWIFPYRSTTGGAPIYTVDSTFTPVDLITPLAGYDKTL